MAPSAGTPTDQISMYRAGFHAGLRVGLLGGGQLARMLAHSAQSLGLEVHVLSKNAHDPAAQVTRHWHPGSPDSSDDVAAFLKHVDLCTFESEFHSGEMLKDARDAVGIDIFPLPETMRTLQDRLSQKEALEAAKVPTAPFMAVHGEDDLQAAVQHFSKGFVLKKRMGGYDGFGTFLIDSESDLADFRAEAHLNNARFIAEEMISFKRELAVSLARNGRGQCVFTPFVETRQTDRRLDWLKGPVSPKGAAALKKKLQTFAEALDYRGLLTFELFEGKNGLLVNEIAPRVHNSGHFGLEALENDQFTLHWKALLDLPLETPRLRTPAFAMVNLVGTSLDAPVFPRKLSQHLHWYGKSENRPGRKMGHLTAVGTNAARLLSLLQSERKRFKL